KFTPMLREVMVCADDLDQVYAGSSSRGCLEAAPDLGLCEAVRRSVDEKDRRSHPRDVAKRIGLRLRPAQTHQVIGRVEGLAKRPEVHQHQLLAAPGGSQLLGLLQTLHGDLPPEVAHV